MVPRIFRACGRCVYWCPSGTRIIGNLRCWVGDEVCENRRERERQNVIQSTGVLLGGGTACTSSSTSCTAGGRTCVEEYPDNLRFLEFAYPRARHHLSSSWASHIAREYFWLYLHFLISQKYLLTRSTFRVDLHPHGKKKKTRALSPPPLAHRTPEHPTNPQPFCTLPSLPQPQQSFSPRTLQERVSAGFRMHRFAAATVCFPRDAPRIPISLFFLASF